MVISGAGQASRPWAQPQENRRRRRADGCNTVAEKIQNDIMIRCFACSRSWTIALKTSSPSTMNEHRDPCLTSANDATRSRTNASSADRPSGALRAHVTGVAPVDGGGTAPDVAGSLGTFGGAVAAPAALVTAAVASSPAAVLAPPGNKWTPPLHVACWAHGTRAATGGGSMFMHAASQHGTVHLLQPTHRYEPAPCAAQPEPRVVST